MKRKIALLAVLIVCLSVISYGTAAYFTTEDIATNVITTGNIHIALLESTIGPDGERVPFENKVDVLPGCQVSKIVEVMNTGVAPAFIRIRVEKAIELAHGVEGEVDLSLVSYDLNTKDWTEKDGYYYYHYIVQPGELTSPLFTSVSFDESVGNEYQKCTVRIFIHAQATQSDNNGTDPLAAAGWPEE